MIPSGPMMYQPPFWISSQMEIVSITGSVPVPAVAVVSASACRAASTLSCICVKSGRRIRLCRLWLNGAMPRKISRAQLRKGDLECHSREECVAVVSFVCTLKCHFDHAAHILENGLVAEIAFRLHAVGEHARHAAIGDEIGDHAHLGIGVCGDRAVEDL